MLTWVMYDISNNKIRNKIIKECFNIGLYRVQKSVFLGDIDDNMLDEMKIKCEDIIDESTDSVYVFPMSKSNFKRAGLIGQAFDKELVSNEIISKFF